MMNIKYFVTFLIACTLAWKCLGQERKDTISVSKIYVITKNDGTRFVGKILSQDAREILIETTTIGQVIVPKHEVREIKELRPGELNQHGDYIPEEVFSTRYFISTNGLPISKGESYIQWNLYGPDFQFGVGKNFGMGIMTTWFGVPIIGSAKYSVVLAPKTSLGVGALLGTGSWTNPNFVLALPFAVMTFGDRRSNISFSGGYGTVWSDDEGIGGGRGLFSVAGMTKVGRNFSLVFDSFMHGDFALLIPGIRWQSDVRRAFQFGFGGLIVDAELMSVPIPMVQWYRKIN